MNTRMLNTIALFGASASGIFAALIAATFTGIAVGFIPLWAAQTIGRYWGIVCLIYVLTQTLPLMAVQTAADRAFKIDRYTSWLPLVFTLVFVGVFAIVTRATENTWIMVGQSIIASVIDLMIVRSMLAIREMIPMPGPRPAAPAPQPAQRPQPPAGQPAQIPAPQQGP